MKAASLAIHLTEADLVDQCRRGDAAAFEEMVRRYQDRVLNTCWRICGDRCEAEDLTQEAFVKAFQSIGRFDGRAAFYTWLFRIAVNLAISGRRKKTRQPLVQSLDRSQAGAAAEGFSMEHVDGDEARPDEAVGEAETHGLVLAALASLDEEHRSVVILRDLESFDYAEIAEILQVPTGTVKSRLHRARMALREKLEPMLGTP